MDITEAVNICLQHATLGTVNQLDSGDGKASQAKEDVDRKRREILRHGFDFNTTRTDLLPDASQGDKVPVNRSDLRLWLRKRFSVRAFSDGNLYIWEQELSEWVTEAITDVRRITDVPNFADIPEDTAQWITWAAASDFYVVIKNADRPSAWLIQQTLDASANAVNGQRNRSLLTGPGVSVSTYPQGPFAVIYGGHWVSIG